MAFLGDMVVKIVGENAQFDRAIDASGKKLKKFEDDAKRVGGALTKTLTLPILLIGAAFVKSASDAEETNSKFNAVFKNQSDSVREWAKEFSSSVNRATIDNIGFLATIQDTLVPLGFARDKAAEMSKSVVELSTDLASFNNLPTEQVVRDIQSAIVGNTETLRKYGVVASQDAIIQEALNSGLINNKNELDATSKAQAIYNLLVKGTTDAQGDAIRTADSFANQLRGLQAAGVDMATEFGTLLLPLLTDIVQGITGLVKGFTELDEGTKTAILVFAGLAAAIGPVLTIVGALTPIVAAVGAAFAGQAIAIGASNAAIIAHTIATKVAAIATRIWNAVLTANPVVLIASALVLAATAIYGFVSSIEEATESTKAFGEETEITKDKIIELKTQAEKLFNSFKNSPFQKFETAADFQNFISNTEAGLVKLNQSLVYYTQQSQLAVIGTSNYTAKIKEIKSEIIKYEELMRLAKEEMYKLDNAHRNAANTIEKELSEELALVDKRFKVFGDTVDVTAEKSKLYKKAIESLLEEGLTPTDSRIQSLVSKYTELNTIIEKNSKAMKELENLLKSQEAITNILSDLDKELGIVSTEVEVFGLQEEENILKARLYKNAIEELITSGLKPEDAILQELINKYKELSETTAVATTEEEKHNEELAKKNEIFTELIAKVSSYVDFASTAWSQLGDIVSSALDNRETEIENSFKKEKKAIEQSTLPEEEKQEKLKALEEEHAADIKEIKLKQFQSNKAFAIVQSIIDTATAVMKTFAQFGFPWGAIPAAIVGVMGAIQTGLIASQQPPSLGDGGLVMPKPGGTQVIMAERGVPEFAIPDRTDVMTRLADRISVNMQRPTNNIFQPNNNIDLGGVTVQIGDAEFAATLTRMSRDGKFQIDPQRGIASR